MEECASTQSTRKTRSEKKKKKRPSNAAELQPRRNTNRPQAKRPSQDYVSTSPTRLSPKQQKKTKKEAKTEQKKQRRSYLRNGQRIHAPVRTRSRKKKRKTADVSYVERLAACSAHVVRSAGNDTGPDTSPAPPACVAALQQAQASISPSLSSRDAARRTCTSARGRAAYLDKTCDPARNVQGRGRSLL